MIRGGYKSSLKGERVMEVVRNARTTSESESAEGSDFQVLVLPDERES